MDGDSDTITQLAVVILLLGMAVPTLGSAYASAGTPIEYQDTASIDYTSDYTLSENATEEGHTVSEIVANGQQLTEGDDYRVDRAAGTVNFLNTTNTTSGDTAQIDYTATQRNSETELAYDIIAPLMALFGIFALVTAVRVLWGYVAEIWEATGG